MASPETDDDIGRLFTVRPADFVAERNAIVKKLKVAGRRDDAATVARLARPTLSVWAVNQIARQELPLLRRLADATAALQGGDRNGSTSYAEILGEHREILKALRLKAEEILSGSGFRSAPDLLAQVVHDLRTGISSPEGRALIESGRLVRDVADDGALNPFAGAPAERRVRGRQRQRPVGPTLRRTTAQQRKRPGPSERPGRATKRGPFSGDGSRTCGSGWRRRARRASATNERSKQRPGP